MSANSEHNKIFDEINHNVRYCFTDNARRWFYHFIHNWYRDGDDLTLKNLREINSMIYLALAYERGVYNNHKIGTQALTKTFEVLNVQF